MDIKKPDIDEIDKRSDEFIEEYLGYARRVADFNEYFLRDNEFEKPFIDYTKLKRFLDSAIDSLKEIDENIVDMLTSKLIKDTNSLYEFTQEFEKKLKAPKIIFKQDFLVHIPYYKALFDELEKLDSQKNNFENLVRSTDEEIKSFPQKRSKEQELEYKKLKKTNVDATHELMEAKEEISKVSIELIEFEKECSPIFLPNFSIISKEVLSSIKTSLNTKIFLLNAVLWQRAKASTLIQNFFKKSDIQGEIGLKTYIEYYMKGVDMTKTKNSDWHSYLNECLKELV
jgi:hypothetical protein